MCTNKLRETLRDVHGDKLLSLYLQYQLIFLKWYSNAYLPYECDVAFEHFKNVLQPFSHFFLFLSRSIENAGLVANLEDSEVNEIEQYHFRA